MSKNPASKSNELRIISTILEAIFPKRDSYRVVNSLTTDSVELHYNPIMYADIIALTPYQEPVIRALIKEAKFHHNEKAWQLLAQILGTYLGTFQGEKRKHGASQDRLNDSASDIEAKSPKGLQYQCETFLVIPIPLSRERQKKRTYNQINEVAKLALKGKPHLKLCTDILYRQMDTQPQTSLKNKQERIKNVANAFGVHESKAKLVKDANVIILDDVTTTGATLKEARAALTPLSPASIKCLALAH